MCRTLFPIGFQGLYIVYQCIRDPGACHSANVSYLQSHLFSGRETALQLLSETLPLSQALSSAVLHDRHHLLPQLSCSRCTTLPQLTKKHLPQVGGVSLQLCLNTEETGVGRLMHLSECFSLSPLPQLGVLLLFLSAHLSQSALNLSQTNSHLR